MIHQRFKSINCRPFGFVVSGDADRQRGAGLLEFGEKPIPEYTEPLQHGIFKHGAPPAFLFGLLAVASRVFHHKEAE